MATNRFQFKLLTGTDPDSQYSAINPKDDMTFYLLGNGKGYFGSVPLFDGQMGLSLIQSLNASMNSTELAAAANQIPSVKAVVDLVNSQMESTLGGKYLRLVSSHTLTQEDIDGTTIQTSAGDKAGDSGLLFASDDDKAVDGDETYQFVSLMKYLSSVNSFESTDSVSMTTGADNKVTADVKVDPAGFHIVVGKDGLSIKSTGSDDIDQENPDSTKLVTESSLVKFITDSVLTQVNEAITEFLESNNFVSYTEDKGTTETETPSGGGGTVTQRRGE